MENENSGGPGFVVLFTLLLIVLKLTGTIHWSWLWVLSPIWIGVTLLIAAIVIVAIAER